MAPPPDTRFQSLSIDDWRQFDALSIEFDPRLTVLTGANASGKSTLLTVLAKHFNWTRNYSSAPIRSRVKDRWSVFGRRRSARNRIDEAYQPIGRLTYSDGSKTEINVSEGTPETRVQYDIQLPNQKSVSGVYLTEHRHLAGNYEAVTTIPAAFRKPDELLEQFTNEVRARWGGSWTGRTLQVTLKESLIAAAVFGEGSQSVDRIEEAWQVWTGFQNVMKAILPETLGFVRLRVRVPDVIVETRSGNFVLDEASGGMRALIEMAWQIFLRSRNKGQFSVLIDEPENHLHPKLQREILPRLLRAFPSVQFVVATHSPFVVTATPDSAVYVLEYNDRRRVVGRRLDYANKAASADDTLRRVLGLESTMPTWAENRFKAILDQYLSGEISSAKLAELRDALRQNGLESEFPTALISASEHSEQRPDGET